MEISRSQRLIFFMIIMIMLLPTVALGSSNIISWWAEANAGLETNQNSYTGFSLDYPNDYGSLTQNSWSSCDLPGSSINPVVYDINGDDKNEIIIGSSSTIWAYSSDCELLTTLNLPQTLMTGTPGFDNYDGDADVNLIIPTLIGAVYDYEFNSTSGQFQYQRNLSNNTLRSFYKIVCPWASGICIGVNNNDANTWYLDLASGKWHDTGTNNYLNTGYGTNLVEREGLSFYRKSPTGSTWEPCTGILGFFGFKCYHEATPASYIVPIGTSMGTYGKVSILTWQSGSSTFTTTETNGQVVIFGGLMDSDDHFQNFIAQVGATPRLYSSFIGHYAAANPDDYSDGLAISNYITGIPIWNLTLNVSSTLMTHITQRAVSNWAIGDFNKDGNKESCYLAASRWNQTAIQEVRFRCMDSAFNDVFDKDVTGVMSINNIALGDFDKGSPNMCIGTFEGIFCYNATSNAIENYFPSIYSGSSWGYPVVYLDDSGRISPVLIFVDDSQGFVITANIDFYSFTCGDTICDPGENAFSCPEDCSVNATGGAYDEGEAPIGTPTENASQCSTGYIEYGICSKMPFNHVCTISTQCLSGVCSNGKCTKPELIDALENGIRQQFGTSSQTFDFICLFVIFGGAIMISMAIGLSVLGAGVSLAWIIFMSIFFTIIGWLSPFFLIGVVVLGVVLFVLAQIMGGSGG